MAGWAETSPSEEQVAIAEGLVIPVSELQFRFSRSSGPGGQHVNRSETRVELLFNVRGSPSLTEAQRQRLLSRLRAHLDQEGILRVVSSETRSQHENRLRAIARFQMLMAGALRQRKRRIPTAPSAAAQEARLAGKRARAAIKKARARVDESHE